MELLWQSWIGNTFMNGALSILSSKVHTIPLAHIYRTHIVLNNVNINFIIFRNNHCSLCPRE